MIWPERFENRHLNNACFISTEPVIITHLSTLKSQICEQSMPNKKIEKE